MEHSMIDGVKMPKLSRDMSDAENRLDLSGCPSGLGCTIGWLWFWPWGKKHNQQVYFALLSEDPPSPTPDTNLSETYGVWCDGSLWETKSQSAWVEINCQPSQVRCCWPGHYSRAWTFTIYYHRICILALQGTSDWAVKGSTHTRTKWFTGQTITSFQDSPAAFISRRYIYCSSPPYLFSLWLTKLSDTRGRG